MGNLDLKNTVYLELGLLPPLEGRVCDILHQASRVGIGTVIINWGSSYPWSFNRSFRIEAAYPEQAIAGFYKTASVSGVNLIPVISCFTNLDFALSLSPFSHLREKANRIGCLDPEAPGAVLFLEELIEDLIGLKAGLKQIILDLSFPFAAFNQARRECFFKVLNYCQSQNQEPILRLGLDREWEEWYSKLLLGKVQAFKIATEEKNRTLQPFILNRKDSYFKFTLPKDYEKVLERIFSCRSEDSEERWLFSKTFERSLLRIWTDLRQVKRDILLFLQDLPAKAERYSRIRSRLVSISGRIDSLRSAEVKFLSMYNHIFPESVLRGYYNAEIETLREEYFLCKMRILQAVPADWRGDAGK